MTEIINTDQQQFWSDGSGRRWTEYQVELDSLLSAGTDAILSALGHVEGKRILDIGCGTGATSLQLACLAGPTGHVHAVDIAQPLLQMAEDRATKAGLTNVTWQHADAQTAKLPDPKFDILASRFGVMFFEDSLSAFENMRAHLTKKAVLAIACWAPVKQNPWFNFPRIEAVKQLGMPPPTPPRTPGPFAFSNPDYVIDILTQAGFQNAQCHLAQVELQFEGNLDQVTELASFVGPVQSIMRDMNGTKNDFAEITYRIRSSFAEFVQGDIVNVPAALNIYTAQNS